MRKNKLFFVLMILFFFQYLYLIWYIYSHWFDYITPDIAADLVLAKTLKDEGHFLLSPNYWYATELHLLGTQIIQSALFRFFSSFRIVFTLSFAIYVLITAFLCGGVLRTVTGRHEFFFLPGLFSLMPLGEYWVYLYQSQAYVAYILCIYLFLYLYFITYRKGASRVCRYSIQAILIVLVFAMGASGMRFLLCPIVPMIITKIYFYFQGTFWANRERKPYCRFDLILVSSALVGCLAYQQVLKRFYSIFGFGDVSWGSVATIKENLYHIPVCIFEVFGGDRSSGIAVMSFEGFLWGIVIFSTILIAGVLIRYSFGTLINTLRCPSKDDLNIINVFSIVSVGMMVLLLVFTSMGQVWGRPLEAHYLAYSLCIVPLVFTIAIMNCSHKKIEIIIVMFLCLRTICGDVILFDITHTSMPEYAEFLNESGMSFGYCVDYGKASTLMAYTDDKVQAVKIYEPVTEDFVVYEFANRKKYKDAKPEFIILTNANDTQASDFILNAEEVYNDEDVTIVSLKE